MKGWKTYFAAAVVALAAALRYFGLSELAEAVVMAGGAIGLAGLGHKLDKMT